MDRQGLRRFPPGLFTLPSFGLRHAQRRRRHRSGVACTHSPRDTSPRSRHFLSRRRRRDVGPVGAGYLDPHQARADTCRALSRPHAPDRGAYYLQPFGVRRSCGSREAPSAVTLEPRSRRVVALQQDAEPTRVPRVVWVVLMIAVAIDFFAGSSACCTCRSIDPTVGWCIEMRRFTFFTRCSGACWASRRSPSSFTCRVEHRSSCGPDRRDKWALRNAGRRSRWCAVRLPSAATLGNGVDVRRSVRGVLGYLIPMIDETPPVAPERASSTT